MRDTSERVAGTAKGNHQLRRRRTEEGGTRHGKPVDWKTGGLSSLSPFFLSEDSEL